VWTFSPGFFNAFLRVDVLFRPLTFFHKCFDAFTILVHVSLIERENHLPFFITCVCTGRFFLREGSYHRMQKHTQIPVFFPPICSLICSTTGEGGEKKVFS
jgi:hypothetical protein